MEGLAEVEELRASTPFGEPSGPIMVGRLAGVRVAFLARHGRGHRLLPSEVPYRANIYALKELGVEQVISVSACGSLREELRPGEFVVPEQLFDQTKTRQNTFFGAGLAAHISVAEPFCSRLGGLLAAALGQAGGRVHRGGWLSPSRGHALAAGESRIPFAAGGWTWST
jgi:5'-methylthioadenosine phosphorylase